MDWTDFDADKQATIMLSLITDHGRATPLVWLTVDKDTLNGLKILVDGAMKRTAVFPFDYTVP